MGQDLMKRFLLLLPLLLTPAARAMDYVKCEAMNKMYSRVNASMSAAIDEATEAFKKENGGFAFEDEDPEGHARWKSQMYEVALPYEKKLDKIIADYKAEGCE